MTIHKVINFISFPVRALTLFEKDISVLDSLRTERFRNVNKYCDNFTLDVGCGPGNIFINKHRLGNGMGIDVINHKADKFRAFTAGQSFPFDNRSFNTVTFIACLNHVPQQLRLQELHEAWRVLKPNGRIIITMGRPLVEIAVHKLTEFYDSFFGTQLNVDNIRGMQDGETFYILKSDIKSMLMEVGFVNIKVYPIWTQWGLNSIYVAEKCVWRSIYELVQDRQANV